ncbi:MAG: late competence development ComFB family protein [Treponema sp.]|nr:late competence development ComFB family protein [Treponema sp.]
MELHNVIEDLVIPKVEDIFNTIAADESGEKLCTCSQCRIDTACYVLNRITPFYVVSNRGAARVHMETSQRHQTDADIAAFIYEGIRRISHNQRPNFNHNSSVTDQNTGIGKPVFNIPTITGRLFSGSNFAPVHSVDLKLFCNGKLVQMKDGNWQNPLHLVSHTEGNFSFWPAPFPAKKTGEQLNFEFTLCAGSAEYETLNHAFTIPVTSEIQSIKSFSLVRAFKLTDLFLFPPGEAPHDRCLV